MANDELRAILREELGVVLVVVRDEIESFKGEMREEMGSFRGEMREEMGNFKSEVRGEMTAAIQASEARMAQRIDQVQKNVLEVKGNVALLDQVVNQLDQKVNQIDRRVSQVDLKVDQCMDVLNETTIKIAEMQISFYNLENKVDTFHAEAKKANQAQVQQTIDLNRRLNDHIATPWNKAHPDPNSAA